MRKKQWSQIRISLKMLLCKKKQSFFLRPAEEILAYQKITLTNVLVVAKTTQKQLFIKIQLVQKNERLKIFIADNDGFAGLGQDFIMPSLASKIYEPATSLANIG